MKENKKARRGDKYTAFALYFVFLAASLCTLFLFGTMTRQEEFTLASSAASLLGQDWSSVIEAPWGAGNLLTGIVYLPAMLLFYDPAVRYYAFIVTGALIFSFVPVIVYRLTCRFSVESAWARVVISVICGFYSSTLVNSRFMFSESFAAVAQWLLIFIIFRAPAPAEKKVTKALHTVAAASLTSTAYFSSPACIAVFVSVMIFCIYVLARRKKAPLFVSLYFLLFLAIFAADIVVTDILTSSEIYGFSGGFISFVVDAAKELAADPFAIICAIAGRVYFFIASTWGIGAVAFAFTVYAARNNHKNRMDKKAIVFEDRLVMLGLFCMITTAVTALFDSYFSIGELGSTQNVILGSLPSDLAAAPAVFILFLYLYRHGINYIRLMATIAGTAVLCAGAMLLTAGALGKSGTLDAVKAAPLAALRPDSAPTAPFVGENIYYPIAMLFIVFAVIIPIVCCSGRYRSRIVSLIFVSLLIYSTVFSSMTSVMSVTGESTESALTASQLSDCIASAGGSEPLIAVIADDGNTAMTVQFYNPDAQVINVAAESELPESCFVISADRLGFDDGDLLMIGRMRGYNVYAKGDAAKPTPTLPPEEQEKPAAL